MYVHVTRKRRTCRKSLYMIPKIKKLILLMSLKRMQKELVKVRKISCIKSRCVEREFSNLCVKFYYVYRKVLKSPTYI